MRTTSLFAQRLTLIRGLRACTTARAVPRRALHASSSSSSSIVFAARSSPDANRDMSRDGPDAGARGQPRKRPRGGRGNGGAPRPRADGARAHVHDRLEHDEKPRSSAPPPRPNLMKNTHGGALAQAQVVEVATGNAPSTTAAFANMGLTEASMRAIHEVMGFTHATAVQDSTLPHIMGGLDVLARAKTIFGTKRCFQRGTQEALEDTRGTGKQRRKEADRSVCLVKLKCRHPKKCVFLIFSFCLTYRHFQLAIYTVWLV